MRKDITIQKMRNIKRNKGRTLLFTAAVCLSFPGFAGCGGTKSFSGTALSGNTAADSYESEDIYMNAEETQEAPAEGPAQTGESVAASRKLIKTVSLDVETEAFDDLEQNVEARAESLGGYIENLELFNGSATDDSGSVLKNARMTLRIPESRLSDFVRELDEISNVTNRVESTEDITLQYVDADSEKKALLVEQERLLELLEQAESMEDILSIEDRLSQVRYRLEYSESQLRTYDNLVDYATVNISIREVRLLTRMEETGAWEKMGKGFLHSVRNIGSGLKNFLIGLVINLPYMVLWAVIILLIFLIIRFFAKISAGRTKNYTAGRQYGVYRNAPWISRNAERKSPEKQDAAGQESAEEQEKESARQRQDKNK